MSFVLSHGPGLRKQAVTQSRELIHQPHIRRDNIVRQAHHLSHDSP